MNILVLDGELRCGLAVARALGKSGMRVHVASERSECLAGASKYVMSSDQYCDPVSSEVEFVEDVKALCRRYSIDVLLPLSEITVEILLRYRNDFQGIEFPYVSEEQYELATNKHKLMLLAQSVGVPVPEFFYFENKEKLDIEKINDFPVVVKPFKSRIKTPTGWILTKVRYAETKEELLKLISSDEMYSYPFMIQQYVSGHGKGVFYLYRNQKKIASFSHRRIREKPPRGGVSVLSESVSIDEKLADYSERLLDAIGWHGVAMVEFKEDDAGNAYLMEINPRFWGSLQLAIDSGVNFPLMLVLGGESEYKAGEYKVGMRLRWFLGDVDHLLLVLMKGHGSIKDKCMSIIRFLDFFSGPTRYETFRWDDMAPFFLELKCYLSDLFRKSN